MKKEKELLLNISKLLEPFTEWAAYESGIIDSKGNTKRKVLIALNENKIFNDSDGFIRNLKQIIEENFQSNKELAICIAGSYLVEHEQFSKWFQNKEMVCESFLDFYDYTSSLKNQNIKNYGTLHWS